MSNRFLGPTFDIHGGGKDLLFPHHENERAQSIAANNGNFARYWVHNGFVTLESEKMSKSLGNFLTIRDALKTYHPEVLRFFLLSKHYRSPLDFSKNAVLDVQSGLVRIYRMLQKTADLIGERRHDRDVSGFGTLIGSDGDPFLEQFIRYMDYDLNTAGAIGLVFEKVKEMNRFMDDLDPKVDDKALDPLRHDRLLLFKAARVLGILNEVPEEFFRKISHPAETPEIQDIEKMIEDRSKARAEKKWQKADEIRDRLKEMGVVLEDGPNGTTWRLDV